MICDIYHAKRLGRIDRLLYPYYKADRDAGIIDDAFVQLLIDCLERGLDIEKGGARYR